MLFDILQTDHDFILAAANAPGLPPERRAWHSEVSGTKSAPPTVAVMAAIVIAARGGVKCPLRVGDGPWAGSGPIARHCVSLVTASSTMRPSKSWTARSA